MNLIIFGNLTENEKNAVSSSLDEDIKIISQEDEFDEEIEIGESFENILIFDRLECNFFSDSIFRIIKDLRFKKETFNEIKVFALEEMGVDAIVSINWVKSLQSSFDLKINVVAELDSQSFAEQIGYVLKLILSKKNNINIEKKDNKVTIYTDGACSGNPGAGGWGTVLIHGQYKKEFSGFEPMTTNNQMELTAVIKALELLKEPCDVELYSDSAYVVNAINKNWLSNWKNNNWVGSGKQAVKNVDLWKRLDNLLSIHNVHFNKVKGHADNELNNRCDYLATNEIAKNANIQ